MFMLCDTSESELNFKEIKNALIEEGNRMEVEIWVQKKGIFEKMQRLYIKQSTFLHFQKHLFAL